MQNSSQSQDISTDHKKETTKESINSICKYQKSYIKNSLGSLLEKSPKNTEIICKFITIEQNERNIRELTKEGREVIIDKNSFKI